MFMQPSVVVIFTAEQYDLLTSSIYAISEGSQFYKSPVLILIMIFLEIDGSFLAVFQQFLNSFSTVLQFYNFK